MQTRIIAIGLVLGATFLPACGSESELDGLCDGEPLTEGRPLEAAAGRPGEGGTWLGNGLENPDISGLDPAYGLNTGRGLRDTGGLLSTADGQEIARYVVECALSEGETISKMIDGEKIELEGMLGLAPEWKANPCDERCQEWVTACLLARTNVTGQTVDLWITADHPNVGLGRSAEYPVLEATFYGNLFQDPNAQFFCHGSEEGQQVAHANGRTCTGEDPEDCGFTTFGSCFDAQRCVVVDGVYPTDCAVDDPATGTRYRSLSTFVRIPEGWQE